MTRTSLLTASLALLAACTDYELKVSEDDARPVGHHDTAAPDGGEDTGSPLDTGETGKTGETGETGSEPDTPGVPDDTVYCTPFDDFADWHQTGEGAWRVEDGMLVEGRYGEYDAISWLHDLGTAEHFAVQVDVAWTGNANDLSGVVWGLDGTEGFAARWDDPQGYYERYSPIGRMDFSRCVGSSCSIIAEDSTAELYQPADLTFATLRAEVDGNRLVVTVDGATALDLHYPDLVGSGPGVVGLFSDDNDGGVWFDNFCVEIMD